MAGFHERRSCSEASGFCRAGRLLDMAKGKARARVYLRTSDTHQPVMIRDLPPRAQIEG
mgnify:CR=1 FL=1